MEVMAARRAPLTARGITTENHSSGNPVLEWAPAARFAHVVDGSTEVVRVVCVQTDRGSEETTTKETVMNHGRRFSIALILVSAASLSYARGNLKKRTVPLKFIPQER